MNNKLTIAATGLDGLIGSRVAILLKENFDFVNLNLEVMDITDKASVSAVIGKTSFDLFLHLAAYTDVDGAEKNQDLARKINVEGTRNIFEAVKKQRRKLIFISTGFVFDGEKPPFYEDSERKPISHYGQTKYEAEKIVEGEAMIVRLDYPYGSKVSYKKDIVDGVVSLLEQGKTINGIVDQSFTPTFIDDIAHSLGYLGNHFSPEVFHIVGSNSLTGYELIATICEVYGFDKKLLGETTYEEFYKGKARRPKKSIMKSRKNNFHPMKTFREGLEQLLPLRYHGDL